MTANRDGKHDGVHEHGSPEVQHHDVGDGRVEAGKRRSQGIVRDERGQEQPADKERAQRVHKSE